MNETLEKYINDIETLITEQFDERKKKGLQDSLLATKWRRDIEHFDDEKNLYELKLSVDYVMNPPTQIRK